MPFQFKRADIPEVIVIEPKAFGDERGYLMEIYKQSEFEAFGILERITQINYSHSTRGVLRGLHYQKQPRAQGKLVMTIRGDIFDVAVDIRKRSPTYGKWVGELLTAENHRMLYIPVGFAHGFVTLTDKVDVVYKVNGAEYTPELERGILWSDPEIAISWPLANPILSENDAGLPTLKDSDNNFQYEALSR